jgi:hypothetical protein
MKEKTKKILFVIGTCLLEWILLKSMGIFEDFNNVRIILYNNVGCIGGIAYLFMCMGMACCMVFSGLIGFKILNIDNKKK